MSPKEFYMDGTRYVPDNVYEKIRYLKNRINELYISDKTDTEVIYLLNYLIEMLPEDVT